mmetsp:Transcript_55758/g.146339  ORF Transcript_55758/g.146339 Transcript_55758/m.146339 type:complete len:207 (-) Transcript_55758:255-875(-)
MARVSTREGWSSSARSYSAIASSCLPCRWVNMPHSVSTMPGSCSGTTFPPPSGPSRHSRIAGDVPSEGSRPAAFCHASIASSYLWSFIRASACSTMSLPSAAPLAPPIAALIASGARLEDSNAVRMPWKEATNIEMKCAEGSPRIGSARRACALVSASSLTTRSHPCTASSFCMRESSPAAVKSTIALSSWPSFSSAMPRRISTLV